MAKKVALTILVIFLALGLGVYYSLPSFIDKEAIKTQLTASFKSLTGLDLEIQGDTVVERFPTPHVIINSMYVHNAQGAASPFLLTVRLVEIWPSYRSLLGKQLSISKINIDHVNIELEHMKSNQLNWQDPSVQTSAPEGLQSIVGDTAASLAGTYINITNGYLHYVNDNTSTSTEYQNIGLVFLNGGSHSESTLKLGLHFRDKDIAVSGSIGSIAHALSAGEVPANLDIMSGKSNLHYDGNAGYREDKFVINGNVALNTDDIVTWISTLVGATDKPVLGVIYKNLPLQAKSTIVTENGKIILPTVGLQGPIINGSARVEISPPYGIDINALIDSFDLESVSQSKLFALKEAADTSKELSAAAREATFQIAPKSFFNMLNFSADLKFKDTLYNQRHIKDSHIQFDMSNGEMTISQAAGTLPGDTRAVFTGIGKEGFQGFTLEGQFDASGADFAEMVKIFKSNGIAIPAQDFKRFRFKANTVLSSKDLRLSEIAARIENVAILGGLIATFGDHTKLEAAMRIGGINLDHFIELWGLEEWRASFTDTTPNAKHDSFLARWLRKLDYDSVINMSLEQFTLLGMPREKAEIKLRATAGKVVIDDLRTAFNGSQLSGSIGLDVTGTLPKVEMKITADTLDTARFFSTDGNPPPETPPPAEAPSAGGTVPRWSHKEFDFHWLELLNATFRLKFGQFKHDAITAQALDIAGSIENRTLGIDSLTGYVLGAQVAGKFNLNGGKIPSMSVAANINALDPVRIVTFLPILKDMTGRYNLSLRLDASGIDTYSWISSLEGTIGLGGSDVDIRGFNLPGVVRTVSYVRTVADILNAVRRAFPGGDTLFSHIEGQWTVAGGILKTSNSKLINDQADGLLTSQVNLVNWQTQSHINLLLKALDAAHPPGMIIVFNGSLDQPEVSLDTRSLEQYVTNKTSERMLHEYGTQ